MSKIKVLLVEDNPADVSLVEEMILEMGLDVHITLVKDGQQAISHLEDGSKGPDLMLVGLKLPKIGGLDLLRLIKERGITIRKVVVLTGSVYDEDRKEAHRLGVDCFLLKPASIFEFDRTTRVLKEILSSL